MKHLIHDLNDEEFLKQAFETEHNSILSRKARLRRNVYLGLFVTGMICVLITAFSGRYLLCTLAVGMATLSLVVMTKYDTQLYFLRTIRHRTTEETADTA